MLQAPQNKIKAVGLMELTRYGVSRVELPGTGSIPGYGSASWVWVHFLGMGPLPGYGLSACHVLE